MLQLPARQSFYVFVHRPRGSSPPQLIGEDSILPISYRPTPFALRFDQRLTVNAKRLMVKATLRVLMGNPTTELRSVTCHKGSHTVTCHRTQVNAPRPNLSQPGRYSIYLPRRDGRLSRPIGSSIAAWPGIEPTTALDRKCDALSVITPVSHPSQGVI